MRKAILEEIYKLAQKDPRVVFIGSDVGAGTLAEFQKEFPDRFFMEGVFEANLVGFMAGLAMAGKIPYFNTIATFMTRRAYEQIFLDAALHNLKIRLVGSGGGAVYAPLGATHTAFEDIALMRAVPGMTILCPSDAIEMHQLAPQTLDVPGPVYIRLAKGGDSVVQVPGVKSRNIGEALILKEGAEILLITTGITAQMALEAASLLEREHESVGVLHFHTVKPLDKVTLLKQANAKKIVIVIEEHSVIGGLGSAVAEILAEADSIGQVRFAKIGVPDSFCHHYGSQADLLRHFGITTEKLIEKVKELL